MKFEIYTDYKNFAFTLDFYIFTVDENNKKSIMTSIDKGTFKDVPMGNLVQPTFSINGGLAQQFLQAMANQVDKLGIKPEGKPILENELTAIKYHLEDMRTLVFKDGNKL